MTVNALNDMNHSLEIASSSKGKSTATETSKLLHISRSLGGGMSQSQDQSSQPDSDDGVTKTDKGMVALHKDFTPGDDDVICGRGKK
jgi:hypothetical protein